MAAGSLTVVGTGIALGVQLTPEARAEIDAADELLYLANEPLVAEWLSGLHREARSLNLRYRAGVTRSAIYAEMVEDMLAPVRAGRRVCAAFYGHPGVFVAPSHEAVRRAHAEGFEARMLPAVSAEDCLFADLLVDPAAAGCASFDATDFLLRPRQLDTTVALLLWQISVVGVTGAATEVRREGVVVLAERLAAAYGADHRVTVYEASPFPGAAPIVEQVRLADLPDAPLTALSTLYVPPAREPDRDPATARALGLA